MVAALICTTLSVAGEPPPERVRKLLTSDHYTVTWKAPRQLDPAATLEIGDGSGHGFTLGWLRFRPAAGGVEVLSVRLDEGRKQYRSKWPPDRAPVTVKRARLTADQYAELLRNLAVVAAAETRRVESNTISTAFADFWVAARLAADDARPLVDLDWAGYPSSLHEAEYARPQAAVALAREAISGLDFKEGPPTLGERRWVSARFARDWAIKQSIGQWWVRERSVILVGAVGDTSALPTLRVILTGDPKDRCVYYAINAVTRLTGIDVRPKPVEEMDIEATRRKLLDALPR